MNCGCLKPKCGSHTATQFWCSNDGRDIEFVSLAEFLPRVTLVAKGVPDDIALEYIRQACQTIARDSLLLERTLELDVQEGVRDYYLENGDAEQVHYVSHIQLGGSRSACDTHRKPLGYWSCREFVFEPNDKIVLTETPKADSENYLMVKYFAMPNQNACEVDKLLFDRYHDVVVNGALSDLLLMRQYEFADPQMAMVYSQKFKQGIAQVKIDVMNRFQRSSHIINKWGRF